MKLNPEKQQRIIDASAKVFAKEGYHHASIANICAEAGISNGALYKYFENKESLFFTVIDYCTSKVDEIYRKHFHSRSTIFEAIENLFRGLAVFSVEYNLYLRIYSNLGSSSMNRFADETAEKFRKASSIYTIKLVEESKESGEIRKSMETEKAAYLIDTIITMYSYSLVSEYQKLRFKSFFAGLNDSLSTEDLIERIISMLRQALEN
ncbi:MAG TPA: TetR/AcrR family transcriptional regulator [Desulfitobacteriaceae bacterium]|nr:TetR/AcrR family transcriptional regulator [Desulfitobacteriaceae bacterium]